MQGEQQQHPLAMPNQDMRYQGRDVNYINPSVKYVLFSFNFLFWLLGVLMIAIGLYAFMDKWKSSDYPASIDVFQILVDISVLMAIVGSVVFVVSTTGCIGALRENSCLLKCYSGFLLMFLLAELAMAAFSLIYPHKVTEFIEVKLSPSVIKDYREKPDLQNLIDFTQMEFQCCGLTERDSYKDWSRNEYFFCNESNPSVERCGVPYSCCRNNGLNEESQFVNVMCGYGVQRMNDSEVDKRIYTTGCIPAISTWASRNLNIVGGVAIGAAVSQLVVIHLARTLENQIARQKALWAYDEF